MKKFFSAFNVFESTIMVIGMAIMVFLNFFNIICRVFLPQSPFSYTDELVVVVFLWVTMFGISYGYRQGAHTMLDFFTNMFPRVLQIAALIFSAACSILLMILITKVGLDMVINQITHNQVTPGMRWPMAISSSAIPVGSAVTIISVLKTTYDEMKMMLHPEAAGGKEEE